MYPGKKDDSMDKVTSVLIDTPVLFYQDKSIVYINNPGNMSSWIRGYPTKDPEDANKGVYFDILTGWKIAKLDDFINLYDLNQGNWQVNSQGWFSEKMNNVLDNYDFGSSVTRILKSMDILIHRYKLKVIECFINLNMGVLVYTVRSVEYPNGDIGVLKDRYANNNILKPLDGRIVFTNTLEIESK